MLLHEHAIARERRCPHAACDRRQPDLAQELPQVEAAGQDVGALGQGGELAGESCLAVLAASKAALGLTAAPLGLAKLAATDGTDLTRSSFDPEAPAASLAALGAVAADV